MSYPQVCSFQQEGNGPLEDYNKGPSIYDVRIEGGGGRDLADFADEQYW